MFTLFTLVLLFGVRIDCLIENQKIVQWTLTNRNGSISVPGKAPGGVYSDLHNAGIIGDILYRFNDVLTRWVAYDYWTYEGQFTVTPDQLNCDVINLVLHGVDTVAYVELNDHPIGSTDNMFVRYVFDIKKLLLVGENILRVVFQSPVEAAKKRSERYFSPPACVPDVYNGECHVNQLRKMQASFSWDWGPAFPSVGLWKPVIIEYFNYAIIRSITTHIEKSDEHWDLKVKVYLEVNKAKKNWAGRVNLELTVDGPQKMTIAKYKEVPTNDKGTVQLELNMTISQNVVRTWWPNGYGDQPLYPLKVSINSFGTEEHYKTINIGFRTVELIEENASNILSNTTASKGLTFYFKVNGYPLFMKGSNWIPSHILPEFSANVTIVEGLLVSAMDAHMNMLRVWGGGLYEWEFFYKLCDQLGILIWQDFPFACSMYPTDPEFLESVKTEIQQNVLRIQYHPSVAIWAGNNENEVALRGNWYQTEGNFNVYKSDYIKLYVDTIKPIVEELDPGRRYIVSSPTNGLESEKEGYIATDPYDPHYGDTHYYNYMGDNWDANIYPRTRFASEYGFQSLPTIKTMKTATKDVNDLKLKSEYSQHRQHSPFGYDYILSQITRHLNLNQSKHEVIDHPLYKHLVLQHRNDEDLEYFEKFVYYSQITQAMAIKAETEFYRQCQEEWYTMGALYWQLNDVWQAPSWSGIEYGNNWKMLHYFAMSFFAPVLVSPRLLSSGDVHVYLLNDRFVPIDNGEITVDVYNWTSFTPIMSNVYSASAAPLSSTKQDISLALWNMQSKDEIFIKFTFKAEGVAYSPTNFLLPKPLKAVIGLQEPTVEINITKGPMQKGFYKFFLDIEADKIVLFLWMETDLKNGYFEENGIIITQRITRVNYFSKFDMPTSNLKNAITYQYYVN